LKGEVVKFAKSNAGFNYFEEGYFYFEDATNKVMFFYVSNRGGAMKGMEIRGWQQTA